MSGQSVKDAVTSKATQATEVVRQYRNDFAMVLPSHIRADQWVRLTTGLFRRNAQLAQVAARNQGSMLAALLDCARLGLEPGDTYHLVPFGNEIVGIPDYTGLIELIYRAGAVKSVKVDVVHKRDLEIDPNDKTDDYPNGRPRFVWRPSEMDRPHHNPDWFGDRGEMIGAYAYAVLLDGSTSQVILRNAAEIKQVQDFSKTKKTADSPWIKWPDRMWKKTVIRELSKFVPTSAEYRRDKLRDSIQVEAERVDSRDLPDISGLLDGGDVIEGEIEPSPTGADEPINSQQLTKLHTLLGKCGVTEQDAKRDDVSVLVGRQIESTKDLTKAEGITVIDVLERAAKNGNPAEELAQTIAELAGRGA